MSDYAGTDEFHVTIHVSDDNHLPSAAELALTSQGLADRTTFLANRGSRGAYVQTSTLSGGIGGQAYGAYGGSGQWIEFAADFSMVPYLDVPDLEVGDVVIPWVSGSFIQQGNVYAEIKLYATQDYGGSPPPAAAVPGAHARVDVTVDGLGVPFPTMIQGLLVITTAGTCRLRLRGKNPDGATVLTYRVGLLTDYMLTIGAAVFRPTATWGGA